LHVLCIDEGVHVQEELHVYVVQLEWTEVDTSHDDAHARGGELYHVGAIELDEIAHAVDQLSYVLCFCGGLN
jgi:hypothetical protein